MLLKFGDVIDIHQIFDLKKKSSSPNQLMKLCKKLRRFGQQKQREIVYFSLSKTFLEPGN